jgi:DNA-binding MarR family transcriptional regulator
MGFDVSNPPRSRGVPMIHRGSTTAADEPDAVQPERCRHAMELLQRLSRDSRRRQCESIPSVLGPRHVSALQQLREKPLSVGDLAARLGLSLSTVSGVVSELDAAGFVQRTTDAGDRRRTIVEIVPGQRARVEEWLDGASAPLARVLAQLADDERAAFFKALALLDAELAGATR